MVCCDRNSGERFDPAKIARLELHWWQLRRENASPPRYGEVIAQVQEELYGVRDNQMKQAALLRAEMMDYRDERHNGKMQSQDWTYIDDGLQRSYQLLKTGLNTVVAAILGLTRPANKAWELDHDPSRQKAHRISAVCFGPSGDKTLENIAKPVTFQSPNSVSACRRKNGSSIARDTPLARPRVMCG